MVWQQRNQTEQVVSETEKYTHNGNKLDHKLKGRH